ncbi:RISC-loading complex subunit tarbp2-like [Schistocerca gregaria]|uniref:RISC-loading complex subunit tarbp2-like n=1 Tax=Schistocerca gregaria TaxID=7010 RepID=UPI00211F4188|nr:RISC-loading complex subunit tarbp2-like [Schistocerca gregaria]
MNQKTPVSVLQELMMRRGYTPQYELIVDGTGTHDPIFKYKVTAADITAIGDGRAKKEAKHEAARKALLRLNQPDPAVNVAEVESPYKDKTQENSVGLLIDLCAGHNLPPPEFDLLKDEGPAHAKQFTMSCTVSKNQKIATGRTKKQAKQLAAQKLYQKLRESLGDIPPVEATNSSRQISEEELQKKLDLLGKSPFASNYSSSNKSYGYKLPEVIHLLKELRSETLEKLRSGRVEIDSSALTLTEAIAKELNTKLQTTTTLKSIQKKGEEDKHLIILKMELDIPLVQYGKGLTTEEATQNAAAALLRNLLLLSAGRRSG